MSGRRYNRVKPKQGGQSGNSNASKNEADKMSGSFGTASSLASEHGVNEKTIRRDGDFAKVELLDSKRRLLEREAGKRVDEGRRKGGEARHGKSVETLPPSTSEDRKTRNIIAKDAGISGRTNSHACSGGRKKIRRRNAGQIGPEWRHSDDISDESRDVSEHCLLLSAAPVLGRILTH